MSQKAVHTPEYKIIIKRLREVRESVGLNQTDAAKKLRKPQSYISKIESGERRLDVIELKTLAKIYKKPIAHFMGD